MSDAPKEPKEPSEAAPSLDEELSELELSEEEEQEIRALLRGALTEEPGDQPPEVPNVLAGVQQKLRERSGGKFYTDGWSTSKEAPISTYLVTSALMLVFVLATYAILGFLVGKPAEVQMVPAPIRVLPHIPSGK